MFEFGKILIFIGIIIIITGALFVLLSYLGLGKLPGDIAVQGKNWKFFFPITTSILISIILTLILWLISRFGR